MAMRSRVGDVLEVTVPGGFVYLHYIGIHIEYGDGIAVGAMTWSALPVSEALFQDSYVTFYPVRAAVARGFARVVGRLPSPGLPLRLRRPGALSVNGVGTWIIEDAVGEEMRVQLSAEELRLPVAEIWNHEFLVRRVVDGWRPEHEG
jgi:hypothetical protein